MFNWAIELKHIGRHLSSLLKIFMIIIEQFIREMKSSGYNRKSAREAVLSGLTGFAKRVERKTVVPPSIKPEKKPYPRE